MNRVSRVAAPLAAAIAFASAAFALVPPTPGPESTYDEKTNTLKGSTETANPAGGRSKSRTEATWPTADTRLVRIWGPDAAAEPTMKITYTKRK